MEQLEYRADLKLATATLEAKSKRLKGRARGNTQPKIRGKHGQFAIQR